MDYELIFYVSGGVLTASAVITSLIGLRVKSFPGRLGPVVALWFIALIGVTTTFAVLHSQHEEEHHEQEVGLPHATEEAEQEENQ
jgi:hypothetical protein